MIKRFLASLGGPVVILLSGLAVVFFGRPPAIVLAVFFAILLAINKWGERFKNWICAPMLASPGFST